MTLVNIDLQNAGYETSPDDRVVFYSPANRNEQGTIISTAETSVPLVDGKASRDLAPGPVVVRILAQGVADTRAKAGYVPDTESVSLVDVITDWLPPLVDQGVLAILAALEEALDTVRASVAAEAASIRWYRGDLPSNTVLDSMTSPGVYSVSGSTHNATITSSWGALPTGGAGFLTFVQRDSSRRIWHWQSTTSGATYTATQSFGAVTPWIKSLDGNDVATIIRPEINKSLWHSGQGFPSLILSEIVKSSAYTVPTWSVANSIVAPNGKLPFLGGGILEVYYYDASRRHLRWNPFNESAWTLSMSNGEWGTWRKVGDGGALANHNHDDLYYTEAEIDGKLTALHDTTIAQAGALDTQTLADAKAYTDSSFAASAPGGATDGAVDAAVDRAILAGRIETGAYSRPESFGAMADGVADDHHALTAAANDAVSRGVPLLLSRRTYGVGTMWDVAPNITIISVDARIKKLAAADASAVAIRDNSNILGHLTVESYPGEVSRGMAFTGVDIYADTVTLTSSQPGTASNDKRRIGCLIRGENISITNLNVKNHDYAIQIERSKGIDLPNVNIDTYVRGIYLEDVTHAHIGGRMKNSSPNSTLAAGNNGVLMGATTQDATHTIHFDGLVVEDCGEHGFRLAGSNRIHHVRFDHCVVKNVGSCGFKALGVDGYTGTTSHQDLIFTGCIVEDAGSTGGSSAFMLHKVKNVQIVSPIVRNVTKEFSAETGVEFQGAENVTITNPMIYNPALSAFQFYDIRESISGITIDGGRVVAPVALQVNLSRDVNVIMSDILAKDLDVTGEVYRVVGSTATLQGMEVGARFKTAQSLTGVRPDVVVDYVGPFDPEYPAGRGSTWRNTDGVHAVRGTDYWVTLN